MTIFDDCSDSYLHLQVSRNSVYDNEEDYGTYGSGTID